MISHINKRGQIAETMVWFAALFVVLIIMIIFIIFSGLITGEKFFHKGSARAVDASVSEYSDYLREDYRRLEGFLNSQIDGRNVYDLLASDKGEVDRFSAELNRSAYMFFGDFERWSLDVSYSNGENIFQSKHNECPFGDWEVASFNLKDRKVSLCNAREQK